VKISDFGVSHFFEEEKDIGARRLSERMVGSEDPLRNGRSSPTMTTPALQAHARARKLTRRDTDSALAMSGMSNVGLLTKTEGTWCFWSPEMCSDHETQFSGYAADLWAAGVCLYIFVTGKLPFFSDTPTDLFDMIAEANVPLEDMGLSDNLLDLLRQCLAKDPRERAGVGDCLKHIFCKEARESRIHELDEEFDFSSTRNLVVRDEDARKAFSIARLANASVVLKSAIKLRHTLSLARNRLTGNMSTQSSAMDESSSHMMDESSSSLSFTNCNTIESLVDDSSSGSLTPRMVGGERALDLLTPVASIQEEEEDGVSHRSIDGKRVSGKRHKSNCSIQ